METYNSYFSTEYFMKIAQGCYVQIANESFKFGRNCETLHISSVKCALMDGNLEILPFLIIISDGSCSHFKRHAKSYFYAKFRIFFQI